MQHPLQSWGGKGWEFPSAQSRTMAKVYFDSRPHPPPPDPRPFLWTVTVDKSRDDVPPRRLVALRGCDEIPRFVLEIKYIFFFVCVVPVVEPTFQPFLSTFHDFSFEVWCLVSHLIRSHPPFNLITRHVSLVHFWKDGGNGTRKTLPSCSAPILFTSPRTQRGIPPLHTTT